VLDGRDDEAVWNAAPIIDGFRQFAPAEDAATAFRTTTRVVYDDRNVYVFVRAYDPHPDSIVSLLSRRDVKTNSDQIKIIFDSYLDHRTGDSL
jgi:Carbohydrate family 9 binding domain-like